MKTIKYQIKLNVNGQDQVVTASTSISDLQRAMQQASRSARQMRADLLDAALVTQTIANANAAVSQLSSTINDATSEFSAYAAAMREANTMAGYAPEQFDQLKRSVSELSTEIPVARDLLAKGLYQVISNGVPEGNWIDFLNQSAKASVGGLADLGKVVQVTSTMIKNYGLEWSEAGHIQDLIQLTAKNGVTSFEQLAEALPRVTGNAATLGVKVEELMASFATLTGVSGNTSEVSTQLAAVFSALVKPSSEAAEMAKQMGIQFNAASIQVAGGLVPFLSNLDKSIKQFAASSGMLEQEVIAKLFGSAEAIRAFGPLTGQLAQKFADNVQAMNDSAGTIDEAFSTISNSGSATFQKIKNSIAAATDAVSEGVAAVSPYVNVVTKLGGTVFAVSQLAMAFRTLASSQMLASAKGLLLASSHRVLKTASLELSAINTVLRASFNGTAVAATTAKMAVRGLMMATGVGAVIAGLTMGFEALTNALDSTSDAAGRTDKDLQDFSGSARNTAETLNNSTGDALANLRTQYDKLREAWGKLANEQQRKAWIGQNREAFEALGLSVASVADADKIFVDKTPEVVQALEQRAKATAAASLAEDLYKDNIRRRLTLDTLNRRASERKSNVKAGQELDAFGKANRQHFREGDLQFSADFSKIMYTQQGAARQNSWNRTANSGFAKTLRSQVAETERQIAELKNIAADADKAWTKVLQPKKAGSAELPDKGGGTDTPKRIATDQPVEWVPQQVVLNPEELTLSPDATKRLQEGASLDISPKSSWADNVRRQLAQEANIRAEGIRSDFEIGLIGYEEAAEKLNKLSRTLTDLGLKPVSIDIEEPKSKGLERFNEALATMNGALSASGSMAEGMQQIADAARGEGDAFDKLSGVLGGSMKMLEGISQVFTMLAPLMTATTTATAAATAATGAHTAAVTANTGAEMGNAMASGAASAAKLPFPANVAAIAGIVAAILGVAGTVFSLVGSFAQGGLITGPSTSGDRLLAKVNAGEMILNASQQARLFALANGYAHPTFSVPDIRMPNMQSVGMSLAANEKPQVEFKIRGRDLMATINLQDLLKQRT